MKKKKENSENNNSKKSKQAPKSSEEPKTNKKPRRIRIPLSEREVSDDTVYVSNLSEETSEESVKKLFADYNVSEVIIHYAWRGKNNPKLRFAFVTVDPKKQQSAVDDINGKEFEGNTLATKCAHKPVTKEQIDAAMAKVAEKPKRKRTQRRRKPKTSENSDDKPTTTEKSEEKPVEKTKGENDE